MLMRYREPLFPRGGAKRALVVAAVMFWCAASVHFWKFWVFADWLGVIVPGWNP